jgi:hypothetical protein
MLQKRVLSGVFLRKKYDQGPRVPLRAISLDA